MAERANTASAVCPCENNRRLYSPIPLARRSCEFNGYMHSAGSAEARRAVAAWSSVAGRAPLTEDDVVIASGCSGALDLVITVLLNPGARRATQAARGERNPPPTPHDASTATRRQRHMDAPPPTTRTRRRRQPADPATRFRAVSDARGEQGHRRQVVRAAAEPAVGGGPGAPRVAH